jgi:hypothetical protein
MIPVPASTINDQEKERRGKASEGNESYSSIKKEKDIPNKHIFLACCWFFVKNHFGERNIHTCCEVLLGLYNNLKKCLLYNLDNVAVIEFFHVVQNGFFLSMGCPD